MQVFDAIQGFSETVREYQVHGFLPHQGTSTPNFFLIQVELSAKMPVSRLVG